MSALETFSKTGFHATLVQKKEDTKPYLDIANYLERSAKPNWELSVFKRTDSQTV